MTARHTRQAVDAVTAALAAEHDLAEWLLGVLAAVAARAGSSDALTRSRPGSWEAAWLSQGLASAVGPDDEFLPRAAP